MPTLSSLIVEREVATMRQVEEALARQVLYGGDLATNLLELATVSEGALSFMLAETYGVEAAPVGELPISRQETLRLVPGDVALRHGLYPLGVRDGALEVAVSEPLPQVVEDDLAFALGMSLRQKAAPLVRIRQAIARDYGIPLDRRYLRLVAKLEHRDDPSPSSLPPPNERPLELARLPRPASIPPIAYGRTGATTAGMAAVEPPAPTLHVGPSVVEQIERELSHSAATTHVGAARIDEIERRFADGPALDDGVPRKKTLTGISVPPPHGQTFGPEVSTKPGVPPPPPEAAVPDDSVAAVPSKRDLAPPSDFVMEAAAATAAEVERKRRLRATKLDPRALVGWARRVGAQAPPSRRASARRRGPVTAASAEAALEEATTRDGILGAFFDFARQFFEYSALFVVHADLAEGWDAFGPGAERDRITAVGVPLDLPSGLADARDKKVPIVAPLKGDGIDAVLADDLARAAKQPVMLLPLVVRGRTVAILYGDHGESAVELPSVGEVIAFAPLASRAFERLILRKKLASRGKEADEATARAEPPAPGKAEAPSEDEASSAVTRALPAVLVPSKRPLRMEEELVDEGWSSVPEPKPVQPKPAIEVDRISAALREIVQHEDAPPPARKFQSDLPPPPANAAAVRPLANRPIPREEPDHERAADDGPEVSVGEFYDDVEELEKLLIEAAGDGVGRTPSPQVVNVREIRRRGEIDQAPASMAMSVSARPPPVSRKLDAVLPAVLLHSDLVDRIVAGGEDGERAFGEILTIGDGALPAVFARFPGPVTVDYARLGEKAPSASDAGPLLRLVSGMRRLALPFLVVRSADVDPDVRFWATSLLGELHYPDAANAIVPRLFDENPDVRRAALRAARALAREGDAGVPIRDGLDRIVANETEPEHRKLLAIDAIGELKIGAAVPTLMTALADGSAAIGRAAYRALTAITGADPGREKAKWDEWWRREGAAKAF